MRIVVYNPKGGQGKTSLSCALATEFADGIVTNEKVTKFSAVFPENAIHYVQPGEPFPLYDVDTVYDCGGFYDARLAALLTEADLLVVPFMDFGKPIVDDVDDLSNDWHVTFNEFLIPVVKSLNTPIAFVHNMGFLKRGVSQKDRRADVKPIIDDLPRTTYHSIGYNRILDEVIDGGVGPTQALDNAPAVHKAAIQKSIYKLCRDIIERAKQGE